MSNTPTAYIGLEPSTPGRALTWAVLDGERNLLALSQGGLDDAMAFISGFPLAVAAVNAPSHLVHASARKRPAAPAEMRALERDLRQRGMIVPKTPASEELCAPRVHAGLEIYRHLEQLGFRAFPAEESLLWLETNPHAGFCALLGQVPLPRRTLEGRLQRQVALYDVAELQVSDPMDFFEEITRHRLLMGQLPQGQLYTPEQLDALIAAYTALLAAKHSIETTRLGSKEDGWIVLPVGELKEKYS